jgi:hypothetical protein
MAVDIGRDGPPGPGWVSFERMSRKQAIATCIALQDQRDKAHHDIAVLHEAVDDARRWTAHLEAENAATVALLDLEHVTKPCPNERAGPCRLAHQVARVLGVAP